MSCSPRVTTLIPTYKRPLLLKRAVLSVLNQSYPHFVVQILDNASGDDTEQVARNLMERDSRVRYHRHAENMGNLKNLVHGLERVTTDYFTVLSDDDFLMPSFFENGVGLHEQDDALLAFVSTRVLVVDDSSRFSDPSIFWGNWTHPRQRCRLWPPEGMARCLKLGVPIPGVVYRTNVMRSIGVPREGWWNWTESGWNAIAAISHPIEFSPEVGAISFLHPGQHSKRMDAIEFRRSWFEMLVEVRAMAVRDAATRRWWKRHMMPLTYARFLGSLLRFCTPKGSKMYEALAELGAASGLNVFGVAGSIWLARAAQAIGLGSALNRGLDWCLKRARGLNRGSEANGATGDDPGVDAASRVFSSLNRQAGLT